MNDREALLKIAHRIAPYVSTRFSDGDSLADDIEPILHEVGIHLYDGKNGVEVRDQKNGSPL